MRTIYLDNNATTPVAPAVFEAMRPYFTEHYGNPSSPHHMGDKPASAVRDARTRVASFLGCTDAEVVFTSCGTESNNIAIRGVLDSAKGRHVVTTAVEHSAVMNPVKRLGSMGYETTVLAVDRGGRANLDDLRDSLRDDTALVSVMFANNETGVIFPIDRMAEIVHARGIPLHVDCVQGVGKVPIDLRTLGADLVSFSAHKFHGPKGVGALVVRKGTRWAPVFLGGGQERNRRPGTENVPGIVGMAAACDHAESHLAHCQSETRRLRDLMESELLERVPDAFVNGVASERLPNTSNIGFNGVDGHALLVLLDEVGICVSAGSACKSGAGLPSHVLAAMGLSPEEASASLRFSLSALTTEDEIGYCIEQIPAIVVRMRRKFISA
ncbi:MAG: aminotransferase class V-fold PLP-dependent enzyme [Candidatus Latescibacteria bacterium]|nr:aminotransferase class V-fold PLP-dependent enzyme [Candidatus Latescibacterota bacterium]